MKTITTTHRPLKNSPEEKTFWLPTIDAYFSASQHERFIKGIPKELRQWMDDLFAPSLHNVTWIPVTVEDVPEDYNRTIYRGYGPYQQDKLVEPFVIRGRELGEITATVRTHATSAGPKTCVWWKGGYSSPLSSGEQSKLAEWFDEQLIAATTGVLIYDLRVRARDRAIRDTKRYLEQKVTEARDALEEVKKLKV